jgi:hypothetical protein
MSSVPVLKAAINEAGSYVQILASSANGQPPARVASLPLVGQASELLDETVERRETGSRSTVLTQRKSQQREAQEDGKPRRQRNHIEHKRETSVNSERS